MDITFLQGLWFALIAVLFAGYFVLEGFDFGVEMNLATLGKGDPERNRTMLKTIGPIWDGNQVWVLVGGAGIFAAFPEWYATLFSGFYLALLLLLLVLILRVCAFKWREKRNSAAWHKGWDIIHIISGFVPALLWGVAFANIVRGVQIDDNAWITTNLIGLLNPFGLLGGLVFVGLFWLHGTHYLALRTTGELREDANKQASWMIYPVIVLGAIFLIWNQLAHSNTWLTWIPLLIAALALVAVIFTNKARREGMSFLATTVAIIAAAAQMFGGLFPNVLPATNDSANSLTIAGSASTEHTLLLMAIFVVLFLPIVLFYQAWGYKVFSHRLTVGEPDEREGQGPKARIAGAYRAAFEQE